MSKVSFINTTKSKLSTIPIVDGQLIYVTDTQEHYHDYDGVRKIYSGVSESNELKANSAENDGYVTKGSGQANKVWKTDANGVPAWRTDDNTIYSAATTSTAGLMSPSDKTKLDGIATGANAYSLPAASSSTLGGVKSGGDVTILNGVITVNDDSHNHIISNIDGLQTALARVEVVENEISQTAEQIASKVSEGDVSSQLSAETDQITIGSNRLVVNSTNFTLNADGTLTCSNAEVNGKITATNGKIASFTIGPTYLKYDEGGDTLALGLEDGNSAGIRMRGFYGTLVRPEGTGYRGQKHLTINGNDGICLDMTSKMFGMTEMPAVEIFNNVGDNDDVPRGMIRVYNTPDGDGDPASDFTEIDGGHIKCDSIRTHSGADLDVLNANLKNARLDFWVLINGATVNANTDAVLTLLMGRKFSDYRGYISFYIIPYGEYLHPLGQIPLALFNKFSTIHYASNNYYWVDFEYLSDTTLRVKSQYGGRIYVYINIFHIPPLS